MEEPRNEPVAPGPARRYQQDDTCPICLSHIEHPTAVTPCWHVFCRGCIQRWAATAAAATCPMCRGPIVATRPVQAEEDRAAVVHRHHGRFHPYMEQRQGRQQQQQNPRAPLRRRSSPQRAEPRPPVRRQRVRNPSENWDRDGRRQLQRSEILREWLERFFEIALGSGDHAHHPSLYRF